MGGWEDGIDEFTRHEMMRFMRNKEHKVRRGSVLDTRGGL